jgi:hypothetical protein
MVCGEIDGFTIYIFFSVKVQGRVGRANERSECVQRPRSDEPPAQTHCASELVAH